MLLGSFSLPGPPGNTRSSWEPGERRRQAGRHLERPVGPAGLGWSEDIAVWRPLAGTGHLQDTFVQVHVGPGEASGLAGPEAEQEHGEPHGLVGLAVEDGFESSGLVVSEGTALARWGGLGREAGEAGRVAGDESTTLRVGERTGERCPEQPNRGSTGRLSLSPGEQVVYVGRCEVGERDGGDGGADDVAERAGVVGLGVRLERGPGEVASDPASAPLTEGGGTSLSSAGLLTAFDLGSEGREDVPGLGLGAEEAADPAGRLSLAGRDVDLGDPPVPGAVVVDTAGAMRTVASGQGRHANPLLTGEQNASRRFLTLPCVICGVAYGGESTKGVASGGRREKSAP